MFSKLKLTHAVLIVALAGSVSSCGTIAGAITKGERSVHFMQAPNNLEVKAGGASKDVTSELFASSSIGNVTRDYYTSSVKLPYKEKVTIQISSGGESATFDLVPKGSRAIFWGNIFLAPIVGHVIDKVTKNNLMLSPRFIDTPRALEGKPVSEWRSKSKLKRLEKRDARAN